MTMISRFVEQDRQAHAMYEILSLLRAADWRVSIHYDFEQSGEFRTYWGFNHQGEIEIEAEGKTDLEALRKVRLEIVNLGHVVD